jgi:acyl transferase domain-containing protein
VTASDERVVAALRAALKRNDHLQRDIERLRASGTIAVVGMACRFPGQVATPDDLWHFVLAGSDAITGLPEDRGWDLDGFYDPTPGTAGRSYVRTGGFLAGAGDFDASFFGVSPREALAMDPQHRLLLETAWEAIESARIDPHHLRGTATGVFTGLVDQRYGPHGRWVPDQLAGFAVTGTAASLASGRIAYRLGLHGPAITVDTACSSALVAVHLACTSLRATETDLALAGAATVMATPGGFTEFSLLRALASDGRCKAFAAAADGTGWAEGGGVLVLERLADAQRHGHPVLALLRGSAVNSDGASNGVTAPNGPAQERVIAAGLAAAGLAAADVDAVEAHGTGTPLGDPIEANALLRAYGRERANGDPLWLGSVKSNLGHPQAAAGLAGLIKMIQAVRHGVLPRTLHVDAPTPHVDWDSGAVSLLTETIPWPATGRPRRAGVSAFGISGTNAHVIVEQAPATVSVGDPPPCAGMVVPWLCSGADPAGLRAQAARLLIHLERHPDLAVLDVARSLATTRAALPYRAAAVAAGREALLAGIRQLAEGTAGPDLVTGTAALGDVTFVFPGQSGQWDGMAVGLLDTSPVFARRMSECGQALAEFVDWSLEDVLRGEHGAPSLCRVDVVQPALFAVMVSLAALWRSYGVEPAAVTGHSQGEFAAAAVIGALSLSDAARLVALRGKAIIPLCGRGGMVAVALPPAELERTLAPWADRLCVAAVNGIRSRVVSGDLDALDAWRTRCTQEGITTRVLQFDYAAHSPQIAQIRDELHTVLSPIRPRACGIPFYSSVTGDRLDPTELDSGYWYRNMRATVRLVDVTQRLLKDGQRFFVECGPHPTLGSALAETIESFGADAVVLGSLRRNQDDTAEFTRSLAEAHVRGMTISWDTLFAGTGARLVDLPTYAFQHQRYWFPSDSLPIEPQSQPLPEVEPAATSSTPLAVIRAHAAATLGLSDPAEVADHRGFRDLGFDSLLATRFRNRVADATGRRPPADFLTTQPTPSALAAWLASTPTRPSTPDNLGFAAWYPEAAESGHLADWLDMVLAASRLRPIFTGVPADTAPTSDLAEGPDTPRLFLFPPVIPCAPSRYYERLVSFFAGRRPVTVVPLPGYEPGEPLPGTPLALVRYLADRADGTPAALLGHSSGGWLAHATGGELARRGRPPAGLVLVDTHPPPTSPTPASALELMRLVLDHDRATAIRGDAEVTAMAAYLALFTGWAPRKVRVPTLVLRATGHNIGIADWAVPGDRVPVPGDHFSVLAEHASTTARAVEVWLRQQEGSTPP